MSTKDKTKEKSREGAAAAVLPKAGAVSMPVREKRHYAVYGLLEYHLKIGRGVGYTVEFTGGQLSGYGVSPARFSTSDPVLQRHIEGSAEFRAGKIMRI